MIRRNSANSVTVCRLVLSDNRNRYFISMLSMSIRFSITCALFLFSTCQWWPQHVLHFQHQRTSVDLTESLGAWKHSEVVLKTSGDGRKNITGLGDNSPTVPWPQVWVLLRHGPLKEKKSRRSRMVVPTFSHLVHRYLLQYDNGESKMRYPCCSWT